MAKLTVNEASGDFTHVWVLDHTDLIAIGTGGTKVLATIPAHGSCSLVQVAKITAATGSTSVVFDIGTTVGDPDEFIDNLDADGMTAPVANTGDAVFQSAATTTVLLGEHPAKPTASALPVYLKLTDASIASLTGGKWIVGLKIQNLGRFA